MTLIRKDFDYYHNLHDTITHALLYLLMQVSENKRYVPTSKRNELLVKYLKPKVTNKELTNIKKDLKLMIQTARKRGGNLEKKLYELNEKANQTKVDGLEKLYKLLVHLHEEEGLESKLFEEGITAKPGVLYMLQEHLEHGFNDKTGQQHSPVTMLIQLERAPELIDVINRYGWFTAEMKEWNNETYQAHILVHPFNTDITQG
ncbi:DUF2913 family protein [Vibrio mediterranei]|uniref:DUF2913 family protein n=1 Tax=Vibrio mediterranei TaxID=689 RepID=UPI001EFC364B|nr:DUF2913 family protein [Vibrio mediterranei]MCG9657938.1 DUF2913 family protein [Vibrio mediterranei]